MLALVLSLLAMPWTARAADGAASPTDQTLCLSDGQQLESVRITDMGTHRTVRVGEIDVRVPAQSLGADCSALHVADLAHLEGLRTVTLSDGQRLYGTPSWTVGAVSVALLDERRIFMPSEALVDVGPLERDAPGLEGVRKRLARDRSRRAMGIAGTVGLGVVGAAAIAGVTWGVVAAASPASGEPAR